MPLEARTASAAQCREQAESWQRYAAKAAEKEREALIAREMASQRLAQAQVLEYKRQLDALAPVPEAPTEHLTDDVELLESKTIGPRELLIRVLGFGNIDAHGDVIESGAVTDFLKTTTPEATPLLYLHREDSIPLGVCREWRTDRLGLIGRFSLFDSPRAAEVASMAKGLLALGNAKLRAGASIGYRTLAHRWGEQDGRRVRFLTKIQIREVSVTPHSWQSNPTAQILEAKSLAAAAVDQPPADHTAILADIGKDLAQWHDDDLHRTFQVQQEADRKQAHLAARIADGSLPGLTPTYNSVRERLAKARLDYESHQRTGNYAAAGAALTEMRNMNRWLSAAGLHASMGA